VLAAEKAAAEALVTQRENRKKAEEAEKAKAADAATTQQAAIMAAIAAATAAAGVDSKTEVTPAVAVAPSSTIAIEDDSDEAPRPVVRGLEQDDESSDEGDDSLAQELKSMTVASPLEGHDDGLSALDDFDAGGLDDGFLSD